MHLSHTIAALMLTRSIPILNFVLSLATSNENSPTENIAMLKKNILSPFMFANKYINRAECYYLHYHDYYNKHQYYHYIFYYCMRKSISVPMAMKKNELIIRLYGAMAFSNTFSDSAVMLLSILP